MLRKKTDGVAKGMRLTRVLADLGAGAIDRRTFLRRSGMTVGGLAAASAVGSGMVPQGRGASGGRRRQIEIKKTVCTHCSVGCTVIAEVQNGVWIGQEPGFDSPINLGRALRQGRGDARARARRPAPEISDEARRRQMEAHLLGPGDRRDRRQAARRSAQSRARIRSSGWARPSTPTSRPTCSASSRRSGAPTTSTTRPASAIRPRSPASPIPGATAR